MRQPPLTNRAVCVAVLAGLCVAALASGPACAQPPAIPLDEYLAPQHTGQTKAVPPEMEELRQRLIEEIGALVDGPRLAPLRVEQGLGGCEYFFDHSGETFLALSMAAPHLPDELRRRTGEYLAKELEKYPPHTARCLYPIDEGERRERYIVTEDLLAGPRREKHPHPMGNLYALWLYAERFDAWPAIEKRWPEMAGAFEHFLNSGWRFDPQKGALDGNRYLGSLIALAWMGRRLGHDEVADRAKQEAERLAAALIEHYRGDADDVVIPKFDNVGDFDRWRASGAGGFFFRVGAHKAKVAKFHDLVPEVGRLLAENAPDAGRVYLKFVDRSLPGWYLVSEERQFHFGENFVDYPDFSLDIFLAKAYIGKAPAEKLARWVDIPWCKGDLYFIQKLAVTLDAATGRRK
jgi:hypothetical protein